MTYPYCIVVDLFIEKLYTNFGIINISYNGMDKIYLYVIVHRYILNHCRDFKTRYPEIKLQMD